MKMVRSLLLGSALMLAGCAGQTSIGGVGTIDTGAVQNAAVAACGFLPTASTVANILAAGNPLVQTASAIANAICAAVTSKSAKRGAAAPTVNGVVVHGRFIR